jgi:hypothetical protein
VHSWKSIIALTLLIALLIPVAGQAHVYQGFSVDVPFAFAIGDHKFKAGTYVFVILGPGLMAVQDSRKHLITTLMTRDIRSEEAANSTPHLVFGNKKGHSYLVSIWLGNGPQGLEILGEEVAMRQTQPPPPVILPYDLLSPLPHALRER